MRSDTNQDLGWLAFRYIADEMSAEEVVAFEQRLAIDQGAREAVARAVELAHAVAVVSAEVSPISVRRHRWRRPTMWLAAAAAASVAGILLWQAIRSDRDEAFYATPQVGEEVNSKYGEAASKDLAIAWAKSGQLAEPDAAWELEMAPGSEEFDALAADDGVESDSALPGWLLEAVYTREDDRYPSDGDREES